MSLTYMSDPYPGNAAIHLFICLFTLALGQLTDTEPGIHDKIVRKKFKISKTIQVVFIIMD